PDLVHDGGGEVVVAASAAQHGPQVGFAYREQTAAELALGREADPVAAGAEGLGHAGDDADLPRSVPVAPAGRGLGSPPGGLEGEDGVDGVHDLLCGHNLVLGPPSV